jgi:hypothetical protein
VDDVARSPEFCAHLVETTWGDATPLERLITLAVDQPAFTQTDIEQSASLHGVADRKSIADALATLRVYAVLDAQGEQYRIVNPTFAFAVRHTRDVSQEIRQLRQEVGA